MGKTIAIIELYQHDEVLRHYLELLRDSEYNIKIFCSKVVYDCLKDLHGVSSFKWTVQKENQSISGFLREKENQIKSTDLVLITTAQSHYKYFKRAVESNVAILLVHNAHSFLAPQRYLYFKNGIKDRLRWLKAVFTKTTYYKRELLNALSAIVFPESTILEYVKYNFEFPKHLTLLSLPFVHVKEEEQIRRQNSIVIPCTVDPELRDYELVLKGIKSCLKQHPEPLEIVLLGKPKGNGPQIIQAFQQLESSTTKIITFEDYIPPELYQTYLTRASFLILPLKENVQSHIYLERYGYSKISGGINDVIRSLRPALIPEFYPLNDKQHSFFETYNESNFEKLLKNWIIDRAYLKLTIPLGKNQHTYRKEEMQNDFLDKIRSILM